MWLWMPSDAWWLEASRDSMNQITCQLTGRKGSSPWSPWRRTKACCGSTCSCSDIPVTRRIIAHRRPLVTLVCTAIQTQQRRTYLSKIYCIRCRSGCRYVMCLWTTSHTGWWKILHWTKYFQFNSLDEKKEYISMKTPTDDSMANSFDHMTRDERFQG